MKRRAALMQLSREHHTALVLTQRIAQAGDEATMGRLMQAVPSMFERELEPHFQVEETTLLPRLEALGETVLVQRAHAEHRELRDLAARIATGDSTALKPFGVLLRAHVRFEERDLFPTAETVLPAAYLDEPA